MLSYINSALKNTNRLIIAHSGRGFPHTFIRSHVEFARFVSWLCHTHSTSQHFLKSIYVDLFNLAVRYAGQCKLHSISFHAISLFDRKQKKNDGYETLMKSSENVEAILYLSVTALARVITGKQPMPRPDDSDALMSEYRSQVDPVQQWLDPGEGWLEPSEDGWSQTDRLYQVYRHWYQHYTGERFPKYMSRPAFGKKLASKFSASRRLEPDGKQHPGYRGVRIQPEWDRLYQDD